MKRIQLSHFVVAAAVLLAIAAMVPSLALATTPNPTGVIFNDRIFNDCTNGVVNHINTYPGMVRIDDQIGPNCTANGADLDNWRFSEDGATEAVFMNNSAYRFGADLVITGQGMGESGLQVSPWWSTEVDGRLNVKTDASGEIACFGGRLPFFSFTAAFGLHYVAGTIIHLEITYLPHSLSSTDPATIEYVVGYGGNNFTSGPLAFDEGNPAENPPYGLWGELNYGRVGAHAQSYIVAGQPAGITATWNNVFFQNLEPTKVKTTTWGTLRHTYH